MNEPKITTSGRNLTCLFEKEKVEVSCLFLIVEKLAVKGEITIFATFPPKEGFKMEPVHGPATFNFSSTLSRAQLKRTLESRDDERDWYTIIEYACRHAISWARRGEPAQMLWAYDGQDLPLEWALWPLLQKGKPTVLFGDGGTMKSTIVTIMCIAMALPTPIVGWQPKLQVPLYLDYEDDEDTFTRRLAQICTGMGLPDAIGILHRHCDTPLIYDQEAIQTIIVEHGITVVVIDSVEAAITHHQGGREGPTSEFYNALRGLGKGITTILIDHISKDGDKKGKAIGSVMKGNRARSTYEVRKFQGVGDKEVNVALYHRKVNEGPLQKTHGYRLDFSNESIAIARLDAGRIPTLREGMSVREQVLALLEEQGPMTLDALNAEIGRGDQVKARLNELAKSGKVVKGDTGQWALRSWEEIGGEDQ